MKKNEQHLPLRVGWICGWGTTAQVWEDCIESWKDATHVILPIADWFDCASDLETVLARAETAIQKLAAEAVQQGQRWRLVGWSLGGMVALGVWSRWMQRQMHEQNGSEVGLRAEEIQAFQGIDLIASSLCFVADPPRKGWSPRVIELMKTGLQSNPQELSRVLQRFREQVGLQEHQLPDSGSVLHAWSINALLLGLDALKTWDFREEIQALQEYKPNGNLEDKNLAWLRRMRWLHGDQDKTCPVAAMPVDTWIETELVAGLGHALFLERPELVHEWLQG